MPTPKQQRRLREHLDHVKRTYDPKCPICGNPTLVVHGEYTLSGTQPRRPVALRSLGCTTCGHLMFFELPETVRGPEEEH